MAEKKVENTVEVKDGVVYLNGAEAEAIRVKVYKRKDGNSKEFLAYKAICSNKRYLDLSFTMECGNPKDTKDFVLIAPIISVDTNRMYPRVYVIAYTATIPFDKSIKDTLTYVKSCE